MHRQELKFETCCGEPMCIVTESVGSQSGSQRAQSLSNPGRHQATLSNKRCLPGQLYRTDNTFEKSRRDGGIRTRGLLLPNQLQPDAGRGRMLPDVAPTRSNPG
jgi:hypothetical protein